uniref:Uncharacterized protein n=1 Tax=Anguilla anguilla TaxID=7936 RepID=A0A0E9VD92_ANGAN
MLCTLPEYILLVLGTLTLRHKKVAD